MAVRKLEQQEGDGVNRNCRPRPLEWRCTGTFAHIVGPKTCLSRLTQSESMHSCFEADKRFAGFDSQLDEKLPAALLPDACALWLPWR